MVLDASRTSVAAAETPTVLTAFSVTFVIELRRRTAGSTADAEHGREFLGDVTQHGVLTREQLLDISVVRYRLAQTAGHEQTPNLFAVNALPAAARTNRSAFVSLVWCHDGQAADDERVV